MKSGFGFLSAAAGVFCVPLLMASCCSGVTNGGQDGGGGAPSVPHGLSSTTDSYCLTCHKDGIGGAIKTPHPGLAGCVTCHKTNGSGISIPHQTSSTTDVYCLGCHQNGDSGAKKTPHPTLAGCVSCHAPGGGDGGTPVGPSAPHGASSKSDSYCLFCHKDGRGGAPVTLHPDRGGCSSCHATTSGQPPTGQAAPHGAATTTDSYCLGCHKSGLGGAKVTDHPDMTGCISCHKTSGTPPGGPAIPHDTTSNQDSYCLGCHKDGIGSAPKTSHPGQAGCTACHYPGD